MIGLFMRKSDKQESDKPTRWYQTDAMFRAWRSSLKRGSDRSHFDPRQMQRLRRFGKVCLLPSGFCVSLVILYLLAFVNAKTLFSVSMVLFGGCLCFFYLFISGINLKASDKNLTAAMSVSMLLAMLWIFYEAPMTQVIFVPLTLLLMMSSAFRLQQRTLVGVAMIALIGGVLVVALNFYRFRDFEATKLSLMHMGVLAIALPGCVILSKQVRRLYRSLYMVSVKMESIEEHARRDELTGCFNRRYMMAALQQQKHLADSSDQSLCLAVIDLDHFKCINDEVGHLAGDEVLRAFSKLAQQSVRLEDVFGRYGGEEFLLLLPDVELLSALNTIERIRSLTETRLGIITKLERKVTVSIGLTQYISGESVLDLFARADEAMYMAKKGGRNQVVVVEPVEPVEAME
jgi:diguanylate cyclase (GGDEF)-like protein